MGVVVGLALAALAVALVARPVHVGVPVRPAVRLVVPQGVLAVALDVLVLVAPLAVVAVVAAGPHVAHGAPVVVITGVLVRGRVNSLVGGCA